MFRDSPAKGPIGWANVGTSSLAQYDINKYDINQFIGLYHIVHNIRYKPMKIAVKVEEYHP